MGLNERLLGVIDELYAGALERPRASNSLDKIASLLGASGGIMYLMDEVEHRVIHTVSLNFEVDTPTQVDGEHAATLSGVSSSNPIGFCGSRPFALAYGADAEDALL